jgi:hypothetical protein
VLAVLFLASCKKSNSDTITISKEEYQKLNSDIQKYPKPFSIQGNDGGDLESISGIVLGSDSHEYLSSYHRTERVLTHYVDCELCTQRRIDFENLIIGELNKIKKDTIK